MLSPGTQVVYQGDVQRGVRRMTVLFFLWGAVPVRGKCGARSAQRWLNLCTDVSMIQEVCGLMPCVLVLVTGRALRGAAASSVCGCAHCSLASRE